MNPIRLLRVICRVFYYEGINGFVVRVRHVLRRGHASPTLSELVSERERWERDVLNGLAGTRMVEADPEPGLNDVPAGANNGRSLLMLIPPPERGSGGRMTMARILQSLSEAGLKCHTAFYPEVPDHDFDHYVKMWHDEFSFLQQNCPVIKLSSARERVFDIAIATFWPGAYIVQRGIRARSRGYLVQDYEPYFYPPGSNYAFAEESYRLGLWGLCASPWLARKLADEHGMQTMGFTLGIEESEYRVVPSFRREERLVIAYVRQHTERRGYELVMWALKKIKDEIPGVRIEIFGDAHLPPGQFLWIDMNHGILGHDKLCELYNRATVGIITSFTNYSLIPNEMIACGCAVVDLDTECTRSVFPEGSISLAPATPQGVAAAVKNLITDSEFRENQTSNGFSYIKDVSWVGSLAAIKAAVMRFASQGQIPSVEPDHALGDAPPRRRVFAKPVG